MSELRIAVFAEGSTGVRDRAGNDVFVALWRTALVRALGLRVIDLVFPISKKHIIALDAANPTMVGAAEALDQLIARRLRTTPFDAAVVAWDLEPEGAGVSSRACRWNETVALYAFLSGSAHLPEPWRAWARQKHEELASRPSPAGRTGPPVLARHGIYAVCMAPVFEGLLAASEEGVRRALGLQGLHVPRWPPGWHRPGLRRPELHLLQPAILAAKGLSPRPAGLPAIRGDMRTAKHEWADYLVRKLFSDPHARPALDAHQLARRLREVLR